MSGDGDGKKNDAKIDALIEQAGKSRSALGEGPNGVVIDVRLMAAGPCAFVAGDDPNQNIVYTLIYKRYGSLPFDRVAEYYKSWDAASGRFDELVARFHMTET